MLFGHDRGQRVFRNESSQLIGKLSSRLCVDGPGFVSRKQGVQVLGKGVANAIERHNDGGQCAAGTLVAGSEGSGDG